MSISLILLALYQPKEKRLLSGLPAASHVDMCLKTEGASPAQVDARAAEERTFKSQCIESVSNNLHYFSLPPIA